MARFYPGMTPAISIVVPCYKSGAQLPRLVTTILDAAADLTGGIEIVLVNDGSPDAHATWKAICAEQLKDTRVVGIDLWRNFGQHSATLAGISQSRGRTVITIDDDLQYNPYDIPRLLEACDAGCDLAYGVYRDTNHGILRGLIAFLIRQFIGWAGISDYAKATSFRCFRGELRPYLGKLFGRSICLDSQLFVLTRSVQYVQVQRSARPEGESTYTLKALFAVACDFVLAIDNVMVKGLLLAAFAFVNIGLALLLARLMNWFTSDLAGITGIVMIFSAVQLCFMAGVLEYNTRLLYSAARRPLFAIKEVKSSDELECDPESPCDRRIL